MSSPTFVASAVASQTSAGTGPLACNVPTGTADGDLLIAHVSVANGGGVPSTPAGWTHVVNVNSGAAGASHVYARIASSEPGSYNWSVSASSEYNVITHAYRPGSGSWSSIADAIAAVRTRVNGSATSHTIPAITTPSTLDMMLVAFLALARGSTTTTKPSPYTLAGNPDSGGTTASATEAAGAYLSVTAGSAASDTFTSSNSAASSTVHLMLIDPGTTQPRIIRHHLPRNGFSSGVTSFAVLVPFCATGDLLVVALAATANNALTAPSGWSLVESAALTAADALWVYAKVADGSEGSSQTWTVDTGSVGMCGIMIALADASALPYHANVVDTASDTTWDVPGVTMAAQSPNAIALAFAGSERGDRTTSAAPSGYTLLEGAIRPSSTSGAPMMAAAYLYETGADPNPDAFTASGANTSTGIIVVTGVAAAAAARAWGYIMGA